MASALTMACSRLTICFLRRVLPNSSTSLRTTCLGFRPHCGNLTQRAPNMRLHTAPRMGLLDA